MRRFEELASFFASNMGDGLIQRYPQKWAENGRYPVVNNIHMNITDLTSWNGGLHGFPVNRCK